VLRLVDFAFALFLSTPSLYLAALTELDGHFGVRRRAAFILCAVSVLAEAAFLLFGEGLAGIFLLFIHPFVLATVVVVAGRPQARPT
jgi:hypothetical protein